MNCVSCNQPLSKERLEAKSDAKKCVPCTIKDGDVDTYCGHLIFAHKTGGELEIVDKKTLENLNRLDPRGYKKQTLVQDEED